MYFQFLDAVPLVTGRVEKGIVKVGDEIEIVGIKATEKQLVLVLRCLENFLIQGQAGIT